jgi:hypothetical protein
LLRRRLDLALVRWYGVYEGVEATWLRWATPAGELLPTKDEKLHVAEQRVETAEQRATAAEAEIARLQALLAGRS